MQKLAKNYIQQLTGRNFYVVYVSVQTTDFLVQNSATWVEHERAHKFTLQDISEINNKTWEALTQSEELRKKLFRRTKNALTEIVLTDFIVIRQTYIQKAA